MTIPSVYSKDGIAVVQSFHSTERVAQRNELPDEQLQHFYDLIIDKVKSLKDKITAAGETFLFYSRSLHQGVVAAWDKMKQAVKIITFLPRDKHFPKPGTTEIVMEARRYGASSIIYVD